VTWRRSKYSSVEWILADWSTGTHPRLGDGMVHCLAPACYVGHLTTLISTAGGQYSRIKLVWHPGAPARRTLEEAQADVEAELARRALEAMPE